VKDNPRLTLREGIEKFHEENAAQFSEQDLSPEAKKFFLYHDTAHVVFGCSRSFFGEGVVKIFTIWGTTLGFRGHLAGYSEADAFSLFRQYSARHLARHIGRLLLAAPRAFVRGQRMTKPWPWSDHSQYLDIPLADIRREFNIKVFSGEEPASPPKASTSAQHLSGPPMSSGHTSVERPVPDVE
jgi:hypothetical protein